MSATINGMYGNQTDAQPGNSSAPRSLRPVCRPAAAASVSNSNPATHTMSRRLPATYSAWDDKYAYPLSANTIANTPRVSKDIVTRSPVTAVARTDAAMVRVTMSATG